MNDVNRIINESGLSKVNVSKYLGVSRQMLYNYLAAKSIEDLPKDKKNKLLKLFNVDNVSDLSKVKVDNNYLDGLEQRLHEGINDNMNTESVLDFKGLNKKEQELLLDIYNLLKEKLSNKGNGYETLKYLYYYIQTMEQVEELKYVLAYMAKSNCFIPALEFIYNEDKQFAFEGILYSAMNLYNGGNASKSKIVETHKKFEQEIEEKKEEKLSRTQQLYSFRTLALKELGYTKIDDDNGKEVFEKIAEIMSRKF